MKKVNIIGDVPGRHEFNEDSVRHLSKEILRGKILYRSGLLEGDG